MIVAAVMLVITHKLRQPMVIGYIVAGMIIGPYTPPFSLISSIQTVNVLSELGIIMLAFCYWYRISNSQTQICKQDFYNRSITRVDGNTINSVFHIPNTWVFIL